MSPKFYNQRGFEIPQEHWQAIWESGVSSIHETRVYLNNDRFAITTIWIGCDPEPGTFEPPKIFWTLATKNGERVHHHGHPTVDDAMECHYNMMTALYPRFFRHRGWLRTLYRNVNRSYAGMRWPYSVRFAWMNIAMWAVVLLTGAGTWIPPYDWFDLIWGPLFLLYVAALVTSCRGLKYAKAQKKIKEQKDADDATFESIMQKEYGHDPGRD